MPGDPQLSTFRPQSRGPFLNRAAPIMTPARLEKPQKNPNRAALRQSRVPFRFSDRRATHSATTGSRLEATHRSPPSQGGAGGVAPHTTCSQPASLSLLITAHLATRAPVDPPSSIFHPPLRSLFARKLYAPRRPAMTARLQDASRNVQNDRIWKRNYKIWKRCTLWTGPDEKESSAHPRCPVRGRTSVGRRCIR
jgi:hypothetical protein